MMTLNYILSDRVYAEFLLRRRSERSVRTGSLLLVLTLTFLLVSGCDDSTRFKKMPVDHDWDRFARGLGWTEHATSSGRIRLGARVKDPDGSWWVVEFPQFGTVSLESYYADGSLRVAGTASIEGVCREETCQLQNIKMLNAKCFEPGGQLISQVKIGHGELRLFKNDGSLSRKVVYSKGQPVARQNTFAAAH